MGTRAPLSLAIVAFLMPSLASGDLTLPYEATLQCDAGLCDVNAFSIIGTLPGNAIYGGLKDWGSFGILGGRWSGVYGESRAGDGVIGVNSLSGARGVLGDQDHAVYGSIEGFGKTAIKGGASDDAGWVTGVGGYASGPNSKGVAGICRNEGDDDELNYGGHFWAEGEQSIGVHGEGRIGVSALGDEIGLYATPKREAGCAAEFQGRVKITSVSSRATLIELGEGLDYAEGFDVSDKSHIDPGSVLVIDAHNPGKLKLGDESYDAKVAGIVAGAQGQGSAVRLGAGQFDFDVALAGRVYCNVDARENGVEPGDLLTTSATPGYAMKATDYARAQGAILGKAMEKLEKGKKGQVLVLVTLQ